MAFRKVVIRTAMPLAALLLLLLAAGCVAPAAEPADADAGDMMDTEESELIVAVAQEMTSLEATLAAAETNCNGCLERCGNAGHARLLHRRDHSPAGNRVGADR